MIRFDFDWSEPLNQLITALLSMLLILQIWLLVKKRKADNSLPARFGIRLCLHVLLWATVTMFVFQPYIIQNPTTEKAVLLGSEVPSDFFRKWSERVGAVKLIDIEELEKNHFDSLIILGQNFKTADFQQIVHSAVQSRVKWIPYFLPDKLQDISWKGVLGKGEMQTIEGVVKSSVKQLLKVSIGAQTLDSVLLNKGLNTFKLNFPAFAQGRTSVELHLGKTTLDTLRFFARPAENLTVRFILESPDFESRNLATWLGKNGHAVIYDAVLSKDKSGTLNINKATEPDLIITDAENVKNPWVKKAVNAGKSVLLMNLTNPAAEVPSINAALGTRFQIRKISNENEIPLGPQLTALPYSLLPANHILNVPGIPVAVEKTSGKVALSLLNQTFPLQLAGDSIRYQNIWNTILAFARPSGKTGLTIQAPVMLGVRAQLKTNGLSDQMKRVTLGKDTVFLDYSAVNTRSATGNLLPQAPGWIAWNEEPGTEIYTEEHSPFHQIFAMHDFIRASDFYQNKLTQAQGMQSKVINRIHKKLPDWAWFALIITFLAAVWIEGKMR